MIQVCEGTCAPLIKGGGCSAPVMQPLSGVPAPGTGRRLTSSNSDCSSWLQGGDKLQGCYQYLLICT